LEVIGIRLGTVGLPGKLGTYWYELGTHGSLRAFGTYWYELVTIGLVPIGMNSEGVGTLQVKVSEGEQGVSSEFTLGSGGSGIV